MIYPVDFENKIDFTDIRQQLLQKCDSSLGTELVDRLTFINDYSVLLPLQQQLREMLSVLSDASLEFPNITIYDMRDSLSRIKVEGLFLDEQELFMLRKALAAAGAYEHFFTTLPEDRFPVLSHTFTSQLARPLASIITRITSVIDQYGKMRDNASPELSQIRRALQQAQGAVGRVLNSILRQAQAEGLIDKDVVPTLREGRLVLPVPPAYKRKIGGIVHDESASGKTVFIEPQQAVEANNRIRELENDERREKIRILIAITAELKPFIPDILLSQDLLAKVDFLRAKTLLAIDMAAIAPEMVNTPTLRWVDAKHPLLEKRLKKNNKKIVPLTVTLTDENRILLISGPNAGGKSVCLKTVALLQYMFQSGLGVPVREDSLFGLFDKLFIDIGDEQSIEDDLSTYSSHLRNMRFFLREADTKTLLLIDEFGGGTEPQIGGAIAQAVLRELNKQRTYGVITTHYDNLKHFAQDEAGIQNGAMLYDRGKMQPMFILSQGQAGSSFAVEIAKQIGLPQQIIAEAVELVGTDRIDYDRHLQDIARDKRYWEQKRQKIKEKEKQLDERISFYEEQIGTAKQKGRQILLDAQQQAKDLLDKSNATIENTIRQIKENAADREKTKEARQQLSDFKTSIEKTVKQQTKEQLPKKKSVQAKKQQEVILPLQKGSRVRQKGQTMVGEVLALTDKQALVAFGNIQSYIPIKELETLSANEAKRSKTQKVPVKSTINISHSLQQRKMQFKTELDLRGYRADEALTELMNYIDDAIMVGAGEVRILHGTGTGALRQVTRQYLANLTKIESFHDAHPDQGGAGITIVEL